MYNLNLPKTTEFNRLIPKKKFFVHTITTPTLRDIYDEQIEKVIWCNKLSPDTINVTANGGFNELEVFDISLKSRSLDKRLLHQMDKGIPYYIFHVLNYDGKYQAWIANKRNYSGKIKVENYFRTLWLNEREFEFSFQTVDKIQENSRKAPRFMV